MKRSKRSTRARLDGALDALYAQVPELNCKGLCYTSCGPVECSDHEHARTEDAGVRIPTLAEFVAQDRDGQTGTCPALSMVGRCTVYDVRPMICRLWGAAEGIPCVYGCRPSDGGRLLTDAEAFGLIRESMRAGAT